MRRGRVILFILVVLLGATYPYYTEIKPVVIFGLRSDYAHAIPFQNIPEGLTSLKAESCGQCHREIYEEWKTSIHAHAYEDPFFQAYWKKDKNIWICLNSHTPLENQQPTLIKGIPRGRVEKAVQEPNPRYDAEYQMEAVTCAACHVRDGVIHGGEPPGLGGLGLVEVVAADRGIGEHRHGGRLHLEDAAGHKEQASMR